MARSAGHHAVRLMIELRVLQPASREIGGCHGGQLTFRGIQGVALLAGFRPQQPLSVLGAELDPL